MHFEISERLATDASRDEILRFAESRFAKVAEQTGLNQNQLIIGKIEATFGSINRTDHTIFSVEGATGNYLLTTDTDYKPSGWFWIFLVLALGRKKMQRQ